MKIKMKITRDNVYVKILIEVGSQKKVFKEDICIPYTLMEEILADAVRYFSAIFGGWRKKLNLTDGGRS